LKPVLHAGEVTATSTSINGKVLDSATGNPVNGQVLVALEQKDATGVDRIMMATLAGNDGTFVFCPIPTGTYDIVVVGEGSDGTGYQPSIVTGAANGQTIGSVSLHLAAGGATGVVQFTGTISSQNGASQGTSMDAQLTALETIASGTFTIPLLPNSQQPSATLSVETAASSACTVGTDCATYAMALPSGGPFLGAYSASGVTLSQSSLQANYILDGLASVPSSGGTADCAPSEQKTQSYMPPPSGGALVAQPLVFVQCQ
jgi:hypothetical protein